MVAFKEKLVSKAVNIKNMLSNKNKSPLSTTNILSIYNLDEIDLPEKNHHTNKYSIADLVLASQIDNRFLAFNHHEITRRLLGLTSEELYELRDSANITEELIIGRLYNILKIKNTSVFQVFFDIADILLVSGHVDIASKYYQKFIFSVNNPKLHFHYITCLLANPNTTNKDLYNAAISWAKPYNDIYEKYKNKKFLNSKETDRKIKLGLICAFFDSSVMRGGILPQLKLHNRDKIEIHCFSDGPIPDDGLQYVENWHRTDQLTDLQMVELIEQNQIDISTIY